MVGEHFPKCWTAPLTVPSRQHDKLMWFAEQRFYHCLMKKGAVKKTIPNTQVVSLPHATTLALTNWSTQVDEAQPQVGERQSTRAQTRTCAFTWEQKPTMLWLTSLRKCRTTLCSVYPEKKGCVFLFLCPVGLKEEIVFTNAWKYFITSSRGRSVLMTWSTGLWLAAGFLKLQRAHWSACQPFGQRWDETDKIIVSNEIQISASVWTWTSWALFSLFLLFFFFFEGGVPYWSWIWRENVEVAPLIQTRARVPAPVELWYRLKFCKRTRHRLSWQP